MGFLRLTLFCLLAGACASDEDLGYYSNAELEPHYQAFETEAALKLKPYPRSSYDYRVEIYREFEGSEYQLRAAVFHKLGHKLMNKQDQDGESVAGPHSLMHPQVFQFRDEVLRERWQDLVDELFN